VVKFNFCPELLSLSGEGIDRRRFSLLAIGTLMSGLFEATAILLGYPVAKLLISGESDSILNVDLDISIGSHNLFVGFIFILTISLWTRAILNHLQYKFAHVVCHRLEQDLLRGIRYLEMRSFYGKSLEELRAANATLITNAVTHSVLPILQLYGHVPLVLLTTASLIYINPSIMIPTIFGIVLIYAGLFLFMRGILVNLGSAAVKGAIAKSTEFEKIINDPRSYLTSNFEDLISDAHSEASRIEHRNAALSASLSLMPRYVIESVIYLAVAFFYFYVEDNNSSIGEVGPLIAVIVLSALRLVPSLQIIFQNIAQVRNIKSTAEIIIELFKLFDKAKIVANDVTHQVDNSPDNFFITTRLEGKSFSFKKGLTTIRGDSGSGKTTLLDLLAGVRPSPKDAKGFVYFDLNVDKGNFLCLSMLARRGLCEYSPQFPVVFTKNLYESILCRELRTGDGPVISVIDGVLERLRFSPEASRNKQLMSLSGGERKKISICRALLSKKPIALFDEPTAGLDDYSLQGFLGVLRDMITTSDRIFVIATHDDRISELASNSYYI